MASSPSTDTAQRRTVRLTFSHPGTQPPVFVAGSFTSPPWQPHEMHSSQLSDKPDLEFYREFEDVTAGDHQYKFRLGSGDWWVTDENASKVTDEAGNVNNHLTVLPERSEITIKSQYGNSLNEQPRTGETAQGPDYPQPETANEESRVSTTTAATSQGQHPLSQEPESVYTSVQSEATVDVGSSTEAQQIPVVVVDEAEETPIQPPDATSGHQSADSYGDSVAAPYEVTKTSVQDTSRVQKAFEYELADQPGPDTDDLFNSAAKVQSPTFRHETLSPDWTPQGATTEMSKGETLSERNLAFAAALGYPTPEHDSPVLEYAPLFRHESYGSLLDDGVSAGLSRPWKEPPHTLRDMEDEDDFEDPCLEMFPTKRADILSTVQSAAERMEEDETRDDGTPPSPVVERGEPMMSCTPTRSISSSTLGSSAMQPVLECIPEDACDPPLAGDAADERAASSATPQPPSSAMSRDPITPPRTPPPLAPKEALLDKAVKTHSPSAEKPRPSLRPSSQTQHAHAKPSDASITEEEEDDAAETDSLRPHTPVSIAKSDNSNESVRASLPKSDSSNEIIVKSVYPPGSWLTPLVHWIVRMCGGRRKATLLSLGVAAVAVSYVAWGDSSRRGGEVEIVFQEICGEQV